MKLLKNNQERNWEAIQWVDEFYDFLKGDLPEGISMDDQPKLTESQAYGVIWYLQEHFSILPDNIDKCDVCGCLFDRDSGGWYTEHPNIEGHHSFCDIDCEDTHPYPIRDTSFLLAEVKDLIRNEERDFQDYITEMYEGNDQINRGERYFLEEEFSGQLYLSGEALSSWISEKIIELKNATAEVA